MIDFTTLPVQTIQPGIPSATPDKSRDGWVIALIVILVLFTIGMIVYGIYQNEVSGRTRLKADKIA